MSTPTQNMNIHGFQSERRLCTSILGNITSLHSVVSLVFRHISTFVMTGSNLTSSSQPGSNVIYLRQSLNMFIVLYIS